MPTIYDVAKRARVSTYTVSSVINQSAFVSPELTKRVLKAVRDLDYTPNALARGLQTRRTKTVGMLIPNIGVPFYARVVCGVEDQLRGAGYSLLLGNTYNRPDEQSRYLNVFRSQQADGYLVFIAAGDESELARLVEMKRPVVFVGRAPNTFEADTVTADNIAGTRLVVEHLVKCGHSRVAIIVGQRSLTTSEERIEGWRRGLRKHKLPLNSSYVADGDWSEESGYEAARRFFELPAPPTGIFAANFPVMTGVLRALKQAKLRCPEDVQVASSDDSSWLDIFEPPITTLVQPSYEMGTKAAGLLIRRMEQPSRKFERIVLSASLRPRGCQDAHEAASTAG